jgi:hypothetical protein
MAKRRPIGRAGSVVTSPVCPRPGALRPPPSASAFGRSRAVDRVTGNGRRATGNGRLVVQR